MTGQRRYARNVKGANKRMNERTKRLKEWLYAAVILRRTCDALKEEFAQLCLCDEAFGDDLIWEMVLERRALGRELAQRGLRHRVLFDRCDLNPLERQILQLRYVQGWRWSQIITSLKKSKAYLMRVHNRALHKVSRQLVCCEREGAVA